MEWLEKLSRKMLKKKKKTRPSSLLLEKVEKRKDVIGQVRFEGCRGVWWQSRSSPKEKKKTAQREFRREREGFVPSNEPFLAR